MDSDVPRLASYGVYISQLIRFARVCNHVRDATLEINVLDGDVPRLASYGENISQLIKFARVCNLLGIQRSK